MPETIRRWRIWAVIAFDVADVKLPARVLDLDIVSIRVVLAFRATAVVERAGLGQGIPIDDHRRLLGIGRAAETPESSQQGYTHKSAGSLCRHDFP